MFVENYTYRTNIKCKIKQFLLNNDFAQKAIFDIKNAKINYSYRNYQRGQKRVNALYKNFTL